MDRRRGVNSRPATSEEVEYWTQAAEAIRAVTNKFPIGTTAETIGRVNRMISAWPTDDTLPAEGFDAVKQTFKRLSNGLREIETSASGEEKALDDAVERVEILIALRKAPEASLPPEKRNKRPRAPSPGTPASSGLNPVKNSVSITLPPRGSVGPSGVSSRDPKARKDGRADRLSLQEGRKVAFHPPPSKGAGDADENTWILALVTKCITNNKYEVQDAEPQEDGQPGVTYTTTIKSIIPLPDPNAVSSYPDFPAGSTVMALYPDTSCFYRAEVIATPKDMQPSGRAQPTAKYMPTYKLKFEDDDNQEHTVSAQWVVEWPGN
ncbi:SAGA-associated factor 29 [Leucoagaricus sp. SymC.cos]|nr:SAGA-associated factor 29 [Leucoagaricus sp. SymC.cos]